jgi:hypothetical protein
MRVKPKVAAFLLDVWSTGKKMPNLVKRTRLSPMTIRRFWKQEQDAGRLPAGARPQLAHNTARKLRVDQHGVEEITGEPIEEIAADNDNLGPPIASPWGLRIAPDGDPLLDALRRKHGNARADLIPRVHDLADASRDAANEPTFRAVMHLVRLRDRIARARQ